WRCRHDLPARQRPVRPLPWWGWLGLALGAGAWGLAWSRFPWLAPWQPFTFTPLWVAYILVVNGLVARRRGSAQPLAAPGYFLALWPLSAAFWWLFEYLNRFAGNWRYLGVEGFSPGLYFLFASLAFATVLPTVLATRDLVAASRWLAPFACWQALSIRRPRLLAAGVLALAAAGLAGLGCWPGQLFPLLWLAPLAILISLQVLAGQPTILAPLARGDWRPLLAAAAAAVVCGLFWEMWNVASYAKWIYTVPYVDRFHLFEMPALGYAGYLPFGLECVAVAEHFLGPGPVLPDPGAPPASPAPGQDLSR
ncbi:MAG: hypothetical protein AB1634_09460, partial [Thermodesulfobacteriota bacterium]